jgi:hypothetical protein
MVDRGRNGCRLVGRGKVAKADGVGRHGGVRLVKSDRVKETTMVIMKQK